MHVSRGTHLIMGHCVVCIYVSSTHKVGEVTAALRLCPLGQSQEERTAVHPLSQPREGLCYGCCAHQERINVSAVPMAPRVFFQPLSSSFAYPGFNKQCEQQKNWHCEQDQRYTAHYGHLCHQPPTSLSTLGAQCPTPRL